MVRGKTQLIVALGLGVAAFGLSYSAIKKREADVRRGWELKPVVVAAVDLAGGTTLTVEMVSQRLIPEQFITASNLKTDSVSYVLGQKVMVPLQAGDPLLWSQFETTRAAERLSTKVINRARAITLSASAITSVGGWVRPNDHVDILGTFKDPKTGEQVSLTLLQNIIVLATGKLTGTTNVNLVPESQRDYSHVSVMVLPEEAEVLVLAQELGALTLSLRNDDDVSMLGDGLEGREQTTTSTLFDGKRMQLYAEKRRLQIQEIRGHVKEAARP